MRTRCRAQEMSVTGFFEEEDDWLRDRYFAIFERMQEAANGRNEGSAW